MKYLEETLGGWKYIDISFEGVDAIELMSEGGAEGVYECVSFEGQEVNFEEIYERFADQDMVITVREAETSQRYGNRVVKVDFMY